MRWISLIALAICLGACAPVQPWQKGNLAKSNMAFDPDKLDARLKEHIYASKEAASGGNGVSTGGCGCN
jgi:hypothetical protein